MNEDKTVDALEHQLRAAFGAQPKTDFDGWQARHADAIAHLNPVVTALKQRRQRLLVWLANVTVAAGVCGLLVWIFAGQQNSLAQAIKTIDNARTVTWRTTTYERLTSMDGKRTWLRANVSKCFYRSPGLYRTEFYDNGNLSQLEITNSKLQKTLRLNLKSKQAVWTANSRHQIHDPDEKGPFAWIADSLKQKPIDWIGQRKWKDKTVNVFRLRREQMKTRNTYDIWFDAETKQLVGILDPGANFFDPTTEPDRDHPAEPKFSKGHLLGSTRDEIVFDAKLDPELFSFTISDGFELVEEAPRPLVTEPDLVEFLGAAARFNKDTFPESEVREYDMERINAAEAKSKADRTDAERKLIELAYKHTRNGNGRVILAFADDSTVPGSFRYIAKDVKLGSADRIVCWYKLKATGTWRAVFADLTVKDVAPKDLPLPVEQ
jgi:outer membrane lipoprotein-sorting protein